jgi:hypothetical protein
VIRFIHWPRVTFDRHETRSPFHRHDRSPLRLTLYTPTLPDPSSDDECARSLLVALRRHHEHLDVAFADGTGTPGIAIATSAGGPRPQYRVTETSEKTRVSSAVAAEGLDAIVAIVIDTWDRRHPDSDPAMTGAAVRAVAAHQSRRRDVFVTNSLALLTLRENVHFRDANILSLQEAAKIVGLLLRSRGIFAFGNYDLIGPGFYWDLWRARLPSLVDYWAACVYSMTQRSDDLIALGQGVTVRVSRALELRDVVGTQFFQEQNNSTLDVMAAHTDYWALMLSGAFDAQARIAHRAYAMLKPKERFMSFRQEGLSVHLRDAGASSLAQLVDDPKTQAILTLIGELRNTVHGAAYGGFTHHGGSSQPASFLRVTEADRENIWKAATRLGPPANRGLTSQSGEVWLEPYAFVYTITDDALRLVDAVARETDVARFFPAGVTREFQERHSVKAGGDEPGTLRETDLLG